MVIRMFMFQLENQYRLFDYSINVNDVIQLMVRAAINENSSPKKSVSEVEAKLCKNETPLPSCSSASSSVSDKVNILFY